MAKTRLGLSATPGRRYDNTGTDETLPDKGFTAPPEEESGGKAGPRRKTGIGPK